MGLQVGEILTVSPFAFFEVKGKVFFDAIKLGQPPLGKVPEGLNTLDVGRTPGKWLGLVNADMAVVVHRNQTDIALPRIGQKAAGGIDIPQISICKTEEEKSGMISVQALPPQPHFLQS